MNAVLAEWVRSIYCIDGEFCYRTRQQPALSGVLQMETREQHFQLVRLNLARVLVIGDSHCPGMRTGYLDFLKRVADSYSITRVVHLVDLVDWASISYHEKSPSLRNASLEYSKACRQVATLTRAFPKADWLIGNHDALTERQAVTAGLPPELLKDYADMWNVGWSIHPRFSKLIIDGVIYSHGDSGRANQDAAYQQAKDNFRSTVIGHFHSQAGVRWWANPEFRVFGLSVG